MHQRDGTNNVASSPSQSTFKTQRLQLAIYLHATKRMMLHRCEACENGKVQFVFDDPNRIGPEAALEFDRGAAVPATDLFASQTFLRRRMSEALENRRLSENDRQIDCAR